MDRITKQTILTAEENLKKAMLSSDLIRLDDLLSPDLIFTNHLGTLTTKEDDISAHQTGTVEIESIESSDQIIKIYDQFAIVSVRSEIVGSFNGESSSADLKFTRVWKPSDESRLQVVCAHSTLCK